MYFQVTIEVERDSLLESLNRHCLEVRAVEDLDGLVGRQLSVPLETRCHSRIENLNLVDRVNLNALTIAVTFVKRFVNSTVIVIEKPSVLHKFNTASVNSRTTLTAIVHDRHLEPRNIFHRDSLVNRVVIRTHALVGLEGPSGPEVKLPLLHF